MIHVCFGLHDKTGRYSKFTGTAMLSLFDNTTSEVTVHILHDNTLTLDNREKFIYLAGRYGQLVKFYNVEQLCAEKINEINRLFLGVDKTRLSIAAVYRLFIPQVLSVEIEKAIYLDSDIIVNLDIDDLYCVELGDNVLGAISESSNGVNAQNAFTLVADGLIDKEKYFNSGVLLMNLNALRKEEETILEGVKFTGEQPKYGKHRDQDILNYCFSERRLNLPTNFNRFVKYARKSKEPVTRKIYHYTVNSIYLDSTDVFNRLWMRYFIKTPFFDEETIGRLYAGVQKLHVELKQSMINISAMMSGKTRAFFTTPDNVDAIKEIFSIRKDESIILAESEQSFKKLIDSMKKAKGKKIFFIVLPNFLFKILTDENFVPGKDFVNGFEFLSEAQGLPLNSYPFVLAM